MTHQNPHWHAPNTIKIVDLAKENSVNCAASLSRHDDDLNQMACHYDNLLGKNWLKLFFLPLSDVFYNVFGSLSRLMIIVFVSCFAPSQPSLEPLPAQMISSNIPRYTKWTLMFDDMKTKKTRESWALCGDQFGMFHNWGLVVFYDGTFDFQVATWAQLNLILFHFDSFDIKECVCSFAGRFSMTQKGWCRLWRTFIVYGQLMVFTVCTTEWGPKPTP